MATTLVPPGFELETAPPRAAAPAALPEGFELESTPSPTPAQPSQPVAAPPAMPVLQPPGTLMHPAQADAMTTDNAQRIAGHVTGTNTISADTPTFLQRLAAPFVGPGTAYYNANANNKAPYDPDAPLVNFGANADLITGGPINKGFTKGAQDFLSGWSTPKSIALLLATGGLSAAEGAISKQSAPAVGRLAEAGAKWMPRIRALVSGGFSYDMIHSALQQSPQAIKQIKSGDLEGATKTITSALLTLGMAGAAGHHAFTEAKPDLAAAGHAVVTKLENAPEIGMYTHTGDSDTGITYPPTDRTARTPRKPKPPVKAEAPPPVEYTSTGQPIRRAPAEKPVTPTPVVTKPPQPEKPPQPAQEPAQPVAAPPAPTRATRAAPPAPEIASVPEKQEPTKPTKPPAAPETKAAAASEEPTKPTKPAATKTETPEPITKAIRARAIRDARKGGATYDEAVAAVDTGETEKPAQAGAAPPATVKAAPPSDSLSVRESTLQKAKELIRKFKAVDTATLTADEAQALADEYHPVLEAIHDLDDDTLPKDRYGSPMAARELADAFEPIKLKHDVINTQFEAHRKAEHNRTVAEASDAAAFERATTIRPARPTPGLVDVRRADASPEGYKVAAYKTGNRLLIAKGRPGIVQTFDTREWQWTDEYTGPVKKARERYLTYAEGKPITQDALDQETAYINGPWAEARRAGKTEIEAAPEPPRPAQPVAAAAKQPWQMTSDEYMDSRGIIAGKREIKQAHNEHSLAVYEAAKAGETIPPKVLAEYPGVAASLKAPAAEAPAPEIKTGSRVSFVDVTHHGKAFTGILTRVDRKAAAPIAHIRVDNPEEYYGGLKTARVPLSELSVVEAAQPAQPVAAPSAAEPSAAGKGTITPVGAKSASSVTAATEPKPGEPIPLESSHASSAEAGSKTKPQQPASEGTQVPEPRSPSHPVTSGAETEVYAEGRDEPYKARYAVRELSDTYPSHNPFSFEPNPDFHYINDRDYSLPANRQRVIAASGSRFRPVKVINTNPDAINGPSIVDRYGNVLGGNNRRMALERVYSLNPSGAAAYRAALIDKAAHFGLDPAEIAKYKQPILVRELDESELDPQHAITEFNYSPAGGHSVGERAAADARGMTPETGKYLGAVMEGAGPDATLTDVLNSKRGPDVVNHLIKAGIFTENERPELLDAVTGNVTSEAKQRIAKMLLGGLFKDSEAFQAAEPSLRNKLERVAGILKQLESNPEWNLTPDVKQAIEAISFERDYGKAYGLKPGESFLIKNAASEHQGEREFQGSMFADTPKPPEISDRARRLAAFIRENNPTTIARAFRQFAEKSTEKSLFGQPDPADAFAASFGERRDPRSGGVSPELLSLGLPAFVREDVAPTLRSVATGLRDSWNDIRKLVFPTLFDKASFVASLVMRGHIGELARRTDQAAHATRDAEKYFNKQPAEENFDFMDRMETGRPQKNAYLDGVAKVLRGLYDDRRKMVQDLGTGKLRQFYENYFAHVWAKPERAKTVMQAFFGKRPLEGSKSFLKQRTYPTIADGRAAGLQPVTDNPVTMTILKIREMDKYIAGQRILKDPEMAAKYVDAREGQAPFGYRKLEDPAGTVYGQSIQQISEFPNAGLWAGLNKVADALDLTHDRGFQNLGQGAVGRADRAGRRIRTLHGSAEDVTAHEIGHQIDWLAGSGRRFVLDYPDAATVERLKRARATLRDKTSTPGDRRGARAELDNLKDAIQNRKEFAKQLRDLADLRGGRKEYVRKREEKMAQLAEMWVGSRELFARTAPKVYAEWKKFLDENPKLHALRDIEGNTEVTPIAQPYDVGGLVIKGHWYLPDGAARMVDNYLSPGLGRYAAFRAAMGLNNGMNLFNLGLSGFHLSKTAFEAIVSKGATGLEQIARGRPIEGAKNILAAPAAPFTSMMKGSKYLKEWYTPGSQGSAIGAIMDHLTSGGARGRLDQMYRTQIGEKMIQALYRGNLPGAAIRAPFAGMEAMTRFIMDWFVPRMKLGTMADMAEADLARLGPDATAEDVQRVMADTVNSVDNRMGEVARDNFFTHRYLKDASMFLMRADQYFLGTVREIGGAAADIVRQPLAARRGEPVNLKRISYVASMLMFHMAASALYQYLHTGKWPEEGEDYFFPKNGVTDEHGHPERTSLMSYVKDVYTLARHPGTTLENKAAPALTMLAELFNNRDFWNVRISNPDDTPVQRAADTAKFVAKQYEPRSIENELRQQKLGASPEMRAEQALGFSPAPADLDQSPAERMAHDLASHDFQTRTPDEAARADLRNQMTRSLQNRKGVPEEVQAARRAGTFSHEDYNLAARAAHESPIQRSFRTLSADDAAKVYAAATPAEKQLLRAAFKDKYTRALNRETGAERLKTLTAVKAALATAPTGYTVPGHFSDKGSSTPRQEKGAPATSPTDLLPGPGKPTAESRWTRTPIYYGETADVPDFPSGYTDYEANAGKGLIQINPGAQSPANPVTASVTRHESVHAFLNQTFSGTGPDYGKVEKDTAVRFYTGRIARIMRANGFHGDTRTEIPAYMAVFSNADTEWTKGVPAELRNKYVAAFTRAIARQDPTAAAKYLRLSSGPRTGQAPSMLPLTAAAR